MKSDLPMESANQSTLRVGTLVYSKAGIFTLFTWLLWGDFSFSLMEAVWPSVLPLKLRSLDASNFVIALLLTTIPSLMNFVLNPIISTASDRYRSKRGRRIPFLLFATPFVTIFLVLLGLSKQLGASLHAIMATAAPAWLTPTTLTIGLISVLVISFRFFELFINTIYWYLFNDVVPQTLLGRFLGLFRVVGALAGALYNFLVYRFAESHASEIFIGAGLLYGSVFLLMCLNVKEGDYPPPEPMAKKSHSPVGYITTFARECGSHRIYLLVYLAGAIWVFAGCIGGFHVFLATSLGLSLGEFGSIAGVSGLVGVALAYPAGVLVDRFHPIRVMVFAKAGLCLASPILLIFLFVNLSPKEAFLAYCVSTVISLPLSTVYNAAFLPMLMRTLPQEKFGQFCAANAMVSALALIVGGLLAGTFLDLMKSVHGGSDFYYRYIPVWGTIFTFASVVATFALFLEWKKLGGDKGYHPPGPPANPEESDGKKSFCAGGNDAQ